MFKKALASLGIGGASVDAVLDSNAAAPGGKLQGRIIVRGGSVEQEIRSIELSVETDYVHEHDDHTSTHTHALGRHRVPNAIRVAPGSQQEIPFAIEVPWGAPLTLGAQHTWLATRLEVDAAIDPKDRDEVRVLPAPLQARLLEAMGQLGFQIRQARCEKSRLGRGLPFVQEIEMRPASGPFRGKLDEVDVVAWAGPGTLAVLLEVDRKARGLGSLLAEMMEMDESRLQLSFTDRDLAQSAAQWAAQLQSAIQRHA
ncbi:MAG: sporulation protein [Gemmatimonadota bacterium]|nr:sporulation protein [Gemmatimonadota bacterium]